MPFQLRLARLSNHVAGHAVTTAPAGRLAAVSGDAAVPGERQPLTEQQLAFIDTFGYLVLPGLVSDKIQEIEKGFSAVWDIDIFSGVNRCKDKGFANEDIVVDVVMTSSANLKEVNAENYKSV